MKRISPRRARVLRRRREVVEEISERVHGQICHRCWQHRAEDPHELLMRSQGGSIVDEANIVPLCRRCHDWIHRHPAAAYAMGWLIRGNHVIREDT